MSNVLFFASANTLRRQLAENEMLRRTLDLDWSATAIGTIKGWPESLTVAARLVLSASAPCALLVGPSATLIYNDAVKAIFEGIGANGLGRSVFDMLPEAADFYRDAIALCAAGGMPSFRDRPLRIARNGGHETAWFDIDFTPVLESDGTYGAILINVFETTGKVQALRASQRAEEQLHLALDASGMIGIWDYDITAGRVMTDERFMMLFGIEGPWSADGIPLSSFTERLHEADRDRVVAEIEAAIRTRGNFRSQYRVTDTGGTAHWVLASGHVIGDQEGNPVRFPGVAMDVTTQVEANAALAESEARFRTLAEAIPQIIWSSDADGRHDYFNSRWSDFTGLNSVTAGADAWKALVHPDDVARVFAVWNKARETGEPYEIEYRFRHHSGEYRWLLVLALPQRHADGSIARWFGTSTDIHESKLIAVERDIIAGELHHRIKNLFSIVGALVSLSARSARDVESYAADLGGRILALNAAHDLVRPMSAQLPAQTLNGLARRLLAPYEGPRGARLSCEGEDVPLSEGAATSFALVFHELATNAAKYGALSAPDGHIVLKTRLEDGRLRVTWKEMGAAGASDTPSASGGFGSKLIALMIEGQKRGKVERYWEADGLRIEIDIPAHAVEPQK